MFASVFRAQIVKLWEFAKQKKKKTKLTNLKNWCNYCYFCTSKNVQSHNKSQTRYCILYAISVKGNLQYSLHF